MCIVVGGLSIKYRKLRPGWQCFIPIPFISDGYKYELVEDYAIQTKCMTPRGNTVEVKYKKGRMISLTRNGLLTIYAGYQWDGASGPSFDSDNFMRGSLVHDALYQLMRAKLIAIDPNKEIADRLLQTLCIENGMSKFRAWYVYKAVSMFGMGAMKSPEPMDEAITSPPKD